MLTVYLKILMNYKDYFKIVGNDKEVLQLTAARLFSARSNQNPNLIT